MFAAIHIPNFPVQSVVRAEPSLRAASLALVDGTPPVWNVVAASESARRLGIEPGMARALVEQFETVAIRHRSLAQEKAAHAALLDLAWSFSPRVEDTSPGTIVIDLAGLSSLFGSEENIAHLLAQRVSAFGLEAQIAVATDLEAAIHAAHGFPGITLIAPGDEAKCLGPLPVSVLGASAEILETLDLWGIRNCESLAALPVLDLSERLGQQGVRLHEWARGASARSIVLAEAAAVFEEEMELEDSVEELEPLSFLLGRLLDHLCLRLTARSLAAGAIGVRFKLDPAGQKDVQIRNDNSRRKKKSAIYEKTLTLPVPIRDSKMLLNLLRLQLQGDPPPAPILKIFMAAEAARPRAVQTGLFLPPSPDVAKLELTIARLANLVGEANVGSPRLVDTHRPGEFRMSRFTPPNEESKKSRRRQNKNAKSYVGASEKPALQGRHNLAQPVRTGCESDKEASAPGAPQVVHHQDALQNFLVASPNAEPPSSTAGFRKGAAFYPEDRRVAAPKSVPPPISSVPADSCAAIPAIGFRMFRPPLPASVQLHQSRPKRVSFRGTRGDVLAASGPWRTSGDWWREDAWHQDEWDLEIRFAIAPGRVQKNPASSPEHGLYRFYFDSIAQAWFVRGIYD